MSEVAELAAKLASEGERLLTFFGTLDDSQWEVPVYTEGATWTVRSVLAHVMTAERAFTKLFEQIRQGGAGVGEDFVIDRYNASQQRKTATTAPAELMRAFGQASADMVAWVSGLSEDELERHGRHPFLGATSLRDMVKMIYIHNQMHYRDIRRALKA